MASVARARPALSVWWLGLASALLLGGCDPAPPPPSGSPSGAPPAAAPSPSCPATAQVGGPGATLERQGTGDGATLWALLFPRDPLLTTASEIKVVWRMTGSGDFAVSATGPDGTVVEPTWGPEAHGGSNWERPGEEWGTGWRFPTAGCWTITAVRGTAKGSLAFRVAEQA
ncbi:hypothetical protein OG994_10445 [Micromonospora globbae]|uniref:Uncharacterized protein n=1 Tax=Micromonospora globbae TaxID=1894969 RepID=A0ABZ1SDK6_9ACTN|nr:hypothetical protein [Micromonospora globbae]